MLENFPSEWTFSLRDVGANLKDATQAGEETVTTSAYTHHMKLESDCLDSHANPAVSAAAGCSDWGDLDAIKAGAQIARGGLSNSKLGQYRYKTSAQEKLEKISTSKKESQQCEKFIAVSAEQLFDAEAKTKFKDMLSHTNITSDYVFATPGLDMRALGRVDGWIREIEAKDSFQQGHARQTAEYAVAIARECGLDHKHQEIVRQAALVHEVGKLALPFSILQKPEGDLEDAELLERMKHPIDGAELLQSFNDLAHLAPFVLSQYEEFNGEGYPQGLSGEQIPIESRIIAVASEYHALISDMRHGPGICSEAAQQQLVDEADKKYDPEIVLGLMQAIESKRV